jgi:hypothetical protein
MRLMTPLINVSLPKMTWKCRTFHSRKLLGLIGLWCLLQFLTRKKKERRKQGHKQLWIRFQSWYGTMNLPNLDSQVLLAVGTCHIMHVIFTNHPPALHVHRAIFYFKVIIWIVMHAMIYHFVKSREDLIFWETQRKERPQEWLLPSLNWS